MTAWSVIATGNQEFTVDPIPAVDGRRIKLADYRGKTTVTARIRGSASLRTRLGEEE